MPFCPKILIADDEALTRSVLEKQLCTLGYPIVRASNGERALNILEDNHDIAALVLDYMMPELNGVEVIKLIKKQERLADLPIVVISGYLRQNEVREVLEAGADCFLPKPVDTLQLLDIMKGLIEKKVPDVRKTVRKHIESMNGQ